jgi:hypothetical protein
MRGCFGETPKPTCETHALPRDADAEISCVIRGAVTNSQRNEHVRAPDKPRACNCRGICLCGIFLGARAECFTATAPVPPQRCEPRRAQLRGDNDRFRQLRSCRASGIGQRTLSVHSLLQNSGVDSAVGRIAVSRRIRLRARAAGSLDHLVDRGSPCSMLIRRRSRICF